MDPAVSHSSFFTLAFLVVGVPESFFWGYRLYTVQVMGIAGVAVEAVPITWGDMCRSSCFLSHTLPQWEFPSGCVNQDAFTRSWLPLKFEPQCQKFLLSVLISSFCCGCWSYGRFFLWLWWCLRQSTVLFKSLHEGQLMSPGHFVDLYRCR